MDKKENQIKKEIKENVVSIFKELKNYNEKELKDALNYLRKNEEEIVEVLKEYKTDIDLSCCYIDDFFVLIPIDYEFCLFKSCLDLALQKKCIVLKKFNAQKFTEAIYYVDTNTNIQYTVNIFDNDKADIIDLLEKNPEKILNFYLNGEVEIRECLRLQNDHKNKVIQQAIKNNWLLNVIHKRLKEYFDFSVFDMFTELDFDSTIDSEAIIEFHLDTNETNKISSEYQYLIPILKASLNTGISYSIKDDKMITTALKKHFDSNKTVPNGFNLYLSDCDLDLLILNNQHNDFIKFFNLQLKFKQFEKNNKLFYFDDQIEFLFFADLLEKHCISNKSKKLELYDYTNMF